MSIKTKFGSATKESNGYYEIRSVKEGNFEKLLHRLIWEGHYNKPVPEGYLIHHINENITDNRIQNLQCVSKKIHNRKHLAKVTKKDVISIRKLKKRGMKRINVYKKIAEPLGLGIGGFDAIWYYKSWQEVR